MPIRIHFKHGGKVEVAPTGYAGKTCHDATRPYEEAMRGPKDVEELTVDETVSVTQSTPQQQTQ